MHVLYCIYFILIHSTNPCICTYTIAIIAICYFDVLGMWTIRHPIDNRAAKFESFIILSNRNHVFVDAIDQYESIKSSYQMRCIIQYLDLFWLLYCCYCCCLCLCVVIVVGPRHKNKRHKRKKNQLIFWITHTQLEYKCGLINQTMK